MPRSCSMSNYSTISWSTVFLCRSLGQSGTRRQCAADPQGVRSHGHERLRNGGTYRRWTRLRKIARYAQYSRARAFCCGLEAECLITRSMLSSSNLGELAQQKLPIRMLAPIHKISNDCVSIMSRELMKGFRETRCTPIMWTV